MNLLQMQTENRLPTDEELMELGFRALATQGKPITQLPTKTKKELAVSAVKKPQPVKDWSKNRAAVAKIAESIPAYNYVPPSDEDSKTKIAIDKIKEQIANEENVKAQAQPQANIPTGGSTWLSIPAPEVSPIVKNTGMEESAKNTMQVNRDESVSNKNIYEKLFEEEMRKAEKEGRTNILYENPYETAARIKSIRDSGIFNPQERGIKNMQDLLGLESQAPTDILSAPLAGLLQSEYGRDVGAIQAARGLSPEQQRSRLLGYGEKIQDDIKDLMAKYLEASKAPKIGTTSTSVEDVIKNIDRDRKLKEIEDKLGMNVKQAAEKEVTAQDPAISAARVARSTGKQYDPTIDLRLHGKRMEDVEPIRAAYVDLLGEVNKVIPGGIEKWNKSIDIPGAGIGKFAIPGLSRSASTAIKTKTAELKNLVLKLRSGGQITPSESGRLEEALGTNIMSTDREYVQSLVNFGKQLKDIMKQREAGVRGLHPEVIDLYKKGGGQVSDDFNPPSKIESLEKLKEATAKRDEEKRKAKEALKNQQTKAPILSKEEFLKQQKGK